MSNIIKHLCDYCQQEAIYSPLPNVSYINNIDIYFCDICKTEYLYFRNKLWGKSIYADYKNRMYRWTYSFAHNSSELWLIEEPGIPGHRANRKVTLLRFFEGLAYDINPNNFIEKLPIYLLFL